MGSIVTGRCPACGRGPVMRDWFNAYETCPECGARFERDEGTGIGSTFLAYGIVAVVVIGLGVLMIFTDSYTYPRLMGLLGLAVVLTVALFPMSKVFWIGVLHSMGRVYPDPPKRT